MHVLVTTIMLKRTPGTKQQRSDDRTTNLVSRLIIIGNLRIDLFSVATVRGAQKCACGGETPSES